MAVVSAKLGVTDKLIKVVAAAVDEIDEAAKMLRAITNEYVETVKELVLGTAGVAITSAVEARIRKDEEDILCVLRSLTLLRAIPPATLDLISGYGEVWSAMTMHAYLDGAGVAVRTRRVERSAESPARGRF